MKELFTGKHFCQHNSELKVMAKHFTHFLRKKLSRYIFLTNIDFNSYLYSAIWLVLIKHLFSILANQLDSLKYSWYCFLFLPPPPLFNKFTICMLMKIKEFFAFNIYHGYLVIWCYPSSETSKLYILIFSLFVEEKLEARRISYFPFKLLEIVLE